MQEILLAELPHLYALLRHLNGPKMTLKAVICALTGILGGGVDILGPLTLSDHENLYVLVAMDYLTKWPEVYAVPDQSAVTTA